MCMVLLIKKKCYLLCCFFLFCILTTKTKVDIEKIAEVEINFNGGGHKTQQKDKISFVLWQSFEIIFTNDFRRELDVPQSLQFSLFNPESCCVSWLRSYLRPRSVFFTVYGCCLRWFPSGALKRDRGTGGNEKMKQKKAHYKKGSSAVVCCGGRTRNTNGQRDASVTWGDTNLCSVWGRRRSLNTAATGRVKGMSAGNTLMPFCSFNTWNALSSVWT